MNNTPPPLGRITSPAFERRNPETKDEMVARVATEEINRKKWRWHHAEANGPFIKIVQVHTDTRQFKEETINRREALQRAQAIIGTGNNWKVMWDQLVQACNQAKRNEQKITGKPVTGYSSKALDMLKIARQDEEDRLKLRKGMVFTQ
jgi:hypothetical protein